MRNFQRLTFAVSPDELRSLCDIRLNFAVNCDETVELVQVDVDSKFFTDWQPLDLKAISERQKKDWVTVGEVWYETRVRWKKKQYNNDDLEIA